MKKIVWCFVIFSILMRDVVVSIPINQTNTEIDDTNPLSTEIDDVDILMESENEYGNFFEGDMDLDDDQLDLIFGGRNVQIEDNYRWPTATVPYVFSKKYSKENKSKVFEAMEGITNVSCVTFKLRSNETDYVQFDVCFFLFIFFYLFFLFVFKLIVLFLKMENTGCHAKVGRRGGKQQVNLDPKCFWTGTIMHELLHG